jgi:hypothetical protein
LTKELVRNKCRNCEEKKVGGQLNARRSGLKYFNQLRSEIQIIIKRNCKRDTTTTRECELSICNR